ncbi:MAG: hypothetical protein P857_81 [Candidatus Xenolissoclinum pacificiensis L6]|uniref:Uncharacterized protein n=1 Tax=Candidatus Xenolissoclinum pacificiensis L6 TaxID=1401685 RepID=W2V072_9RICK|nr:MAG: hypothetical protein P857_81 [Candidatus Xenolissoclinum pacificiensis L6]
MEIKRIHIKKKIIEVNATDQSQVSVIGYKSKSKASTFSEVDF